MRARSVSDLKNIALCDRVNGKILTFLPSRILEAPDRNAFCCYWCLFPFEFDLSVECGSCWLQQPTRQAVALIGTARVVICVHIHIHVGTWVVCSKLMFLVFALTGSRGAIASKSLDFDDQRVCSWVALWLADSYIIHIEHQWGTASTESHSRPRMVAPSLSGVRGDWCGIHQVWNHPQYVPKEKEANRAWDSESQFHCPRQKVIS